MFRNFSLAQSRGHEGDVAQTKREREREREKEISAHGRLGREAAGERSLKEERVPARERERELTLDHDSLGQVGLKSLSHAEL